MTTGVPTQYVTLVTTGGTPIRLADQYGAPYPTTGSGALVFAVGAELTNPILRGAILADPYGFGPGTASAPALFFGADNITGLYASAAGRVSFTSQGSYVGEWRPTGLDVLGNLSVGGVLSVTGAVTLSTPLSVASGGTSADTAQAASVNLSTNYAVTTLAALKALSTASTPLLVSTQGETSEGDGLGATWVFRDGNQSANVDADLEDITWAAPDSDPTGANGAWQRISVGPALAKKALPNFVRDYNGVMQDSSTAGSDINEQNNTALQAYIDEVSAEQIGPLQFPAGTASFTQASVVPQTANGFGLIGAGMGQTQSQYVTMLTLRDTLWRENVFRIGDAENGTITGIQLRDISMRLDQHNRVLIDTGSATYSGGQITYNNISTAVTAQVEIGDMIVAYGFTTTGQSGFNGRKIVVSKTASTIVVLSDNPGAASNSDPGRIQPLAFMDRSVEITNAVYNVDGSITFTTAAKNYFAIGNRIILDGLSPSTLNRCLVCFPGGGNDPATEFTFTVKQEYNVAIPNPGAITVTGARAYPLGDIGTAIGGDTGTGWGFLIERPSPALYQNLDVQSPYGILRQIGGGDPSFDKIRGTSCTGPLASIMYGGYSGLGWPLNLVKGENVLTSGSDNFADGIPPDYQPAGVYVYGNSDGDWWLQAGYTSRWGVRMEGSHYYEDDGTEHFGTGGPQYWRRGAGSDSTHGTTLYINTDGGGYHFNNIHALGSLQDGSAGGSVLGTYVGPLVNSVEFSECLWWVYNKEGLKFDGETLIAISPRICRNSAGLWDIDNASWDADVITLVARNPSLSGGDRGPFLGLQPGDSILLANNDVAAYDGTRTIATVSEDYMTVTIDAAGSDASMSAPLITKGSTNLGIVASGTWAANVITIVNTSNFSGVSPGDSVTLANCTPSSYDGTRTVATVVGDTMTFAATGADSDLSIPGDVSIVGMYSGGKLGATCLTAVLVGGEVGEHEGFDGNEEFGFDLDDFTGELSVAGGDYTGNVTGPFSDMTKVNGSFTLNNRTILGGRTILRGALTSISLGSIAAGRQFNGLENSSATTARMNWQTTSNGMRDYVSHARGGGVPGTHGALSNGDDILDQRSYSSDGSTFGESTRYRTESDGGSAAGSTPGKHIWGTTPSGSATSVDRWDINNVGMLRALSGSFSRGAPVTKTGDFTVATNENWLINNKSGSTCTVTLPSAASFPGREIKIQNYQNQSVVSASSNVIALTGGAASTAILPPVAGTWVTLVSNATNWLVVEQANGMPALFSSYLTSANMNSTADQAIPIRLPSGVTLWTLAGINAYNASTSLTTCRGGFYTGAGKTGLEIGATTQAWTTLTGAAVNATGSLFSATSTTVNASLNVSTLYLSLTTPQGAAATCDIQILGYPLQ